MAIQTVKRSVDEQLSVKQLNNDGYYLIQSKNKKIKIWVDTQSGYIEISGGRSMSTKDNELDLLLAIHGRLIEFRDMSNKHDYDDAFRYAFGDLMEGGDE